MKNLFKFIVPAAIMVLAASCVKEIGSESVPGATRRYNLTFEETTKTELSGVGSKRQVHWSEGDEIQYYTKAGQSSTGSTPVIVDGSSAYLEIPRGRTDEFINAVYGAANLSSSSSENIMYVSSPIMSEQSYTSFSQAHICAAFSNDIENPYLKFHNIAPVFKFTSAASINKVVFYGNSNEFVTGRDLKISFSDGAITTKAVYGVGGRTVTITTNGEVSDFYFTVLPVNFANGITVDCYDADNSLIFSKKVGGPINTISEKGTVKVLNLGNAQDWIASAPPTAIDLGLSVKWASFNVGATKPEEYGDYFTWGETTPKSEYRWANYLFGSSKNGPFFKYVLDSAYGSVDHKTVLDLTDDAAHTAWGDDWRMPTKSEVAELMNTSNCTWTWTEKNGIPGYTVTSLKSGYTANSIFLPANGMKTGTSLSDGGTAGNYWTSSISEDYPYYAISPFFDSSQKNSDNCYRYFGLGVRPVKGAVIPVESIEMQTSLELVLGKTATLSATVSPSNATYKSLTWASSDESIATVDATGKVKAVSIGKATITVYSADASIMAACEVTCYQRIQSITLDQTELKMFVGDSPVPLQATVLPSEYTMKISWSSKYPSVATVSSDGIVTAVSAGSTQITASANDGSGKSAICMVIVNMDVSLPSSVQAVDLGLPSGVKWASCNLGATKPEQNGEYFAWGETAPKTNYDWSTCKWYGSKITKYCTRSSDWVGTGPMDRKTVLDLEDDAAHVNWGGSWRMATDEEWTELRTKCTWTWTSQNGVKGRKVKGPNGNSIFLPAPGYRYSGNLDDAGDEGYYWSSSLKTDVPDYAWYVNFYSGNVYRDYRTRYYGLSVRPVYGAVVPVSSINMQSSLRLVSSTSAILSATVSPSNATYKCLTWSTSDESIATVDATGKVTAVATGKATITAYSADASKTATCEVTVMETATNPNGRDYVDLGLPSGLKWASMNVGATKPEDYGDYFAWGETEPKTNYSWSTYKFELGTDDNGPFSKYVTNSNYGTVDNKTVLDLEDDAAHVNWGGSWRMPTDAEWTELRTKCTWTWTTENGVNGRKITGPNGNSIFLPAAGDRYASGLSHAGSVGIYWSSSLLTGNPDIAWYVYFYSDNVYRLYYLYRYYGFSVRPVTE